FRASARRAREWTPPYIANRGSLWFSREVEMYRKCCRLPGANDTIDDPMILVILVFAGAGLLFIALAIPLIRRRVKPNALYGLRVPATFADEWVWYEANAKSGRDLLIVGILQFVTAIAVALSPGIDAATYLR